jgi:hypothetical protein
MSILLTPASSRAFWDQLADQAAFAVLLGLLAQARPIHVEPLLTRYQSPLLLKVSPPRLHEGRTTPALVGRASVLSVK